MKSTIIRVTLYLAGLFCLAVGVVFAIKSSLGVSPVSSLPLILSMMSSISLGTVTTAVFAFYVLMQIVILRRDFKLKNLLQIFFGFVFGFFVDFAAVLLTGLEANSYSGQLLFLLISSLIVAVGLMLIIAVDIVPGAPEGLMLAICEKYQLPFPRMKVWFDSLSVLTAALLSLVFLGDIHGMREGTVISALLIGKLLGIITRAVKPSLDKLISGGKMDLYEPAAAE